jgi:UDP-N-acetylmuramate--alanine ligase
MPNKEILEIKSKMLGKFNYENMLASIALSIELGIDIDIIRRRFEKYSGIKRRLEIKYSNNDLFVIDDFSSVPAKAKGTLNSLRDEFPNHKIIAIFEPNTGNRTLESQSLYNQVFEYADEVIIPKLRMTKADDGEKRLSGEEIVEAIRGTHKNTKYIPNDSELINYLHDKGNSKTIIVFMGSGSFRGMIQELINRLEE